MEILKQIAISAIPHLITTLPILILTFTNIGKIPDIIAKLDISIENDIAILWSQLTSKCTQVIEEQKCDIQTMECINQLFDRYKKIGGNHGVEVMVKEARAICKKGGK